MDIKDLLKDLADQPDYVITNRLNELIISNYHYQNLNSQNKKIVLDLIKEYQEDIRQGRGISALRISRDNYNLYEKRLKLGLSPEDLADIKEILNALKS